MYGSQSFGSGKIYSLPFVWSYSLQQKGIEIKELP
jgi:hypothetical protein